MRSLKTSIIVVSLTLLGCGAERSLSGVWQQVDCGDGEIACDDGLLYELHLGRFGDKVSGLVQRYTFQGAELDNFGRNAECGCFVVVSGAARGDRLAFEFNEPQVPGQSREEPDPSCRWPDRPTRSLVDVRECAGRRILLDAAEEDDRLEGVIECADGRSRPIAFRRLTRRAHERCIQP